MVGNKKLNFATMIPESDSSYITVRGCLEMLMSHLDKSNGKDMIAFGYGDPSRSESFATTEVAQQAMLETLISGKFNGYASTTGVLSARCAIAKYLNKELPHKVSSDDVYVTAGCIQAIETILSVFTQPNANILLPKPGYPFYESRATFNKLEFRHFNLDAEKGWEVDLAHVEALADENTVAMLVINPGNPTGSVYSYEHLSKIVETAKKLGLILIADEEYGHLTFGEKPFVPMGIFADIVPIITLGSISKRWIVPGWRLGWIVLNDPNGLFKQTKLVQCIESFLNISTDPATFIQAALPHILQNTKDDFFNRIVNLLKHASDILYEKLEDIDCITCLHKPEGSMFVMVKLNLPYLEGIDDCMDFCTKLAKEESVIILPGVAVGMKDWLRITFAVDPPALIEGLDRMKSFCSRPCCFRLGDSDLVYLLQCWCIPHCFIPHSFMFIVV